MTRYPLLALLALTLLGPGTEAQEPETIKGAVGFMPDPAPGLSGGASLGRIDEDWFLTVNLGLTFDLGRIGFGIQAPLRFRVSDEEPKNDEDHLESIREEDWDEPADYLRIIRFVRYGRKGDTLHARVGDLRGVSIGHGTIMQQYYNNLDIDHYQIGGVLDIDADYGGFESVFSGGTKSRVYGGRAFIRPASLFGDDPLLGRFALGVSAVADKDAPYELADAAGNPVRDLSTQTPALDGDRYPRVFDERRALVYGIDAEYRLPDLGILQTIPYADLNRIDDRGEGFHAGVLLRAAVPIISIDLEARGEYRRLDGDYLPAYFGSYYEIQRYNYAFIDKNGTFGLPAGSEVTAIPKRMALEHLDQGKRDGYYGEVKVKVMDLVTASAAYDDYQGESNSNLRAFLSVPALEAFQFNCYYAKFNFDQVEEAFEFDDRSIFLLEGKVPLNTFLSLAARYWRTWILDETAGTYEPVEDWSLGLELNYRF